MWEIKTLLLSLNYLNIFHILFQKVTGHIRDGPQIMSTRMRGEAICTTTHNIVSLHFHSHFLTKQDLNVTKCIGYHKLRFFSNVLSLNYNNTPPVTGL